MLTVTASAKEKLKQAFINKVGQGLREKCRPIVGG